MSLTPILLVGLAMLCIGFALGYLVLLLTGKKEPESKAAPEGKKAAVALPQSEGSPPADPNLAEIARLSTDRTTQGLVVGIGAQVYRSSEALSEEQRNLLGDTLEQLSTWLGHPRPAAAVSPAPVSAARQLVIPAKKPSYSLNPVDMVVNAVDAEAGKLPDEAEMSIPMQVNAILQEKLKGTPIEKRGISLSESPTKDLVVRVGLEKFTGVDAVPYEDVKSLIREAVQEWGRRTAPSR